MVQRVIKEVGVLFEKQKERQKKMVNKIAYNWDILNVVIIIGIVIQFLA